MYKGNLMDRIILFVRFLLLGLETKCQKEFVWSSVASAGESSSAHCLEAQP